MVKVLTLRAVPRVPEKETEDAACAATGVAVTKVAALMAPTRVVAARTVEA
jgi:hypothetical protein